MGTNNLYSRWMRMNQQQSPLNASDTADLLDSSSFATQAPFTTSLTGSTGATFSGAKIVAGSGALVTGTLTITTGLTSIQGFQTTLLTQPTGTGTASSQILVTTITTGSALVTAYSVSSVTGATVAASTSTGTFSWIAFGA